ncbi:MAG: A24 family peptidase [Lachnospiraceae bacterium]|nr:A24 family peptidase [Lachnospiraceae bacterium]
MYICLGILIAACVCDAYSGKIPRTVTVFGMLISQAWVLYQSSLNAALISLIEGMIVLLILYPLFMIGTLGGGDVKLMMILPAYLGLKDSLYSVFFAFAIGALIGCIKLLSEGSLKKRLIVFVSYIKRIKSDGRITRYEIPASLNDGCMKAHQIHFSIPILIGTSLKIGGLF